MKIAVLLNCHAYPELVADTVASIKTWVSNDIGVMIDGACWDKFEFVKWSDTVAFKSLKHNFHKSPYRNITFGLKKIYELFPDYDWYIYTEYDCLFTSDAFLNDLKNTGITCYASDIRSDKWCLPYFDKIMETKITDYKTMLGCCVFYSGEFIKKLYNMEMFDRILDMTESFSTGQFPDYPGYAFEESLYPTLVNHLGGTVSELGAWRGSKWTNKRYMMRFRPNIELNELSGEASIVHPLKNVTCPVRQHYKAIRNDYLSWNNKTISEISFNCSDQKLQYIISGTGRCGTVYLASLLNSIGVSCGHERICTHIGCNDKNYGYNSLASGWAGLTPTKDPSIPLLAESSYMSAPYLMDDFLKDSFIIHVIRKPLAVINSFVNGLHYFQNDTPSNPYEEFISKHLSGLFKIDHPLLRAAYFYIHWNKMIENAGKYRQYFRYRIEDDASVLLKTLGKSTDKYYNNKKCNSVISHNNLQMSDIPEGSIKNDLLEIMNKYYS